MQREIRRLGVFALHDVERRFRRSVAGGQPELPIGNIASVLVPFVGETEYDRPGDASAEGGLNLPFERFAFERLALAQAVHPEFSQHQRFGIGNHLQTGEVILEGALLVQIDIEANEIDVLRAQKLRRRIISEGAEALRIHFLGDADQFVQKILNRLRAAPTDDVRRQFVDDTVCEDRGMPGTGFDGGADGGPGLFLQRRRIQKTDMLAPRNVNEQFKPELFRNIQQPARRHIIYAQKIRAEPANLLEVPLNVRAIRKRVPFRVGPERAISQALEIEFRLAHAKEFSADGGARRQNRSLLNVHKAPAPGARNEGRRRGPARRINFILTFLTGGSVHSFIRFVKHPSCHIISR